ncbi:protease B [Fulvivirga imtechensis AK7]|uniref:Protease B n=1 Tax=Fulvivirga imtechensis AK7 TaxID=1237149 RepID=L8JY51_9BACT|nr:M57 family metalloprotease [Fulvivirga imtechensis]ELR72137.1 protease B [Fulvivirga imtechensis AK7]
MKMIKILLLGAFTLLHVFMISCTEDHSIEPQEDRLEITDALKSQFYKLGFDASDIRSEKVINPITQDLEHFYILENDIMISPKEFKAMLADLGDGPTTEQYHTWNLVNAPRTIKVLGYYGSGSNSTYLDNTMRTALEMAVQSYNNLNLNLTFTLAFGTNTSNYDIVVYRSSGAGGGMAGFPSGGNPYHTVYIQSGTSNYGTVVTRHVLIHEIGHCIGLRHTDYFNRSLSCGSGGNEGDAGYGAVHIPGTPSNTNIDMSSVMLSCFNSYVSGQFSNYDVTALKYLYSDQTPPPNATLSVSPTSVNFSNLSGSKTITVSSNTSWTVTDDSFWISVSPASGTNNGSFTINVGQNYQLCEPRFGTVTISGAGAESKTISVLQWGRSPQPGEICP